YNKLGQRVRRTLPENQFEQFAYDAVGNQVKRTNFLGVVTTYIYDKLNRLLQKGTNNGSTFVPLVSFNYDPFGKRKSMDDAWAHWDYTYDPLHRLILKHDETHHRDFPYTYASGRLENFGTDLWWVHYSWNRLGQLLSVTNYYLTNTYSYDLVGNLTNVV